MRSNYGGPRLTTVISKCQLRNCDHNLQSPCNHGKFRNTERETQWQRPFDALSTRQLPLGLLNAAQGHPMLVELKSGDTLNGHLVQCDTWMNLTLKEVIQTTAVPKIFLSFLRAS